MVHFRSPHQPAHFIRAGRGFKFVGGRLAVAPADADYVRLYAQAHPSLGIVEESPQRSARKPKRTTATKPRAPK